MTREEFGEQFASTMTDEQIELLERLHDNELQWECNAHSEGMDCCVDAIVEARRSVWTTPPHLPVTDLHSTGLLWLINKVVFHPRGFALAMVYQDGEFAHWVLEGDGSEPWRFGSGVDEEQFALVEDLFRAARREWPTP